VDIDDILDYRRMLGRTTWQFPIPEPTVYATNEWLDIVSDMAHQLPADDPGLRFPAMEDCGWAWAENGVLVLFETPITLTHIITSEDKADGSRCSIEPELEDQVVEAMLFSPQMIWPVTKRNGEQLVVDRSASSDTEAGIMATGVWYVGVPNANGIPLVSATVCFEWRVDANDVLGMSLSTRFLYAMLSALGHAMTTSTVMVPANRPMQKRLVRSKLPPIRTLTLTAPSAQVTGGTNVVNWQKSWKVRTHWRNRLVVPR